MAVHHKTVRALTNEICQRMAIPNEPYSSENETLAEFVLDLYKKSVDLVDFKTKLGEMGAPQLVSDTFVELVDRLTEGERVSVKREKSTEVLRGSREPAHVKKEPKEEYIFSTLDEREDKFSPETRKRHLDDTREYQQVKKREPDDTKDYQLLRKREYEKPIPRASVKHEYLYNRPEIEHIYRGRVVNITNFGAFVRLYEIRPVSNRELDGLCHISQFSNDRISHPSEIVKIDQEVYVKVIDIQQTHRGYKISLSMKNINQETGQSEFQAERRGRSQLAISMPKRRLTSPERWEIRQLIASGVLSANDYPELKEDVNAAFMQDTDTTEDNQDFEIELKTEEPPFLKGKEYKITETVPIKIVKKPEGSLNRAAVAGSSLVRERKEKKLEELRKSQDDKRKVLLEKRLTAQDPLAAKATTEPEVEAPVKLTAIESEWRRQMKEQSMGKRTTMSIKEQRESLPVFKMRSELVKLVKENQFLVVVGETGSGKTTQITQYLAEEGLCGDKRMIACTQPRRVAATSVAKRVAEEVGCKVGEEVGYSVRFDDMTSSDTMIKYLTDGMLQREALMDPDMSRYSVIMIDEAHERTIATDVLFALLKKLCHNNPDLKLIITSATLDAEKFSRYFHDCPILKIPGKTFPVEVYYTNEPEMDYISACLDTVMEIHTTQSPGDILVFLTGQEEIDTCCELLYERTKMLGDAIQELIILPVYSSLPSEMQTRIFEPTPANKRKVIIATNIAETSITIDGIYYVIDPGFVKLNAFDPKLGMDSLIISPISQAQANQRKGRAGRTGPGKCYRLYTQSAYTNEMMPQTIPEIQRQNLANTILMLKLMGIDDLINFDFLDPPPTNTILNSLEELYCLGALNGNGDLTKLGRQMSDFPMEPSLSKTLISSMEFQCTEEILTIVAMISVASIFYRPKDKLSQADQRKLKFHSPHGDHLTLLNVYEQWSRNIRDSKKWCLDNFIHERSMKRAKDVKFQLMKIMKRYKNSIMSCEGNTDKIRRTLCAGFFKNSAKKDSANSCYKTLIEKTSIYMHPSSALFQRQNHDYVIYHTLLLTTKEYMHCVTVIDPNWLVELAPNFFIKNDDPSKMSAAKRSEKIQPLYNKFDPSQSWRLTKIKAAKSELLGNLKQD